MDNLIKMLSRLVEERDGYGEFEDDTEWANEMESWAEDFLKEVENLKFDAAMKGVDSEPFWAGRYGKDGSFTIALEVSEAS